MCCDWTDCRGLAHLTLNDQGHQGQEGAGGNKMEEEEEEEEGCRSNKDPSPKTLIGSDIECKTVAWLGGHLHQVNTTEGSRELNGDVPVALQLLLSGPVSECEVLVGDEWGPRTCSVITAPEACKLEEDTGVTSALRSERSFKGAAARRRPRGTSDGCPRASPRTLTHRGLGANGRRVIRVHELRGLPRGEVTADSGSSVSGPPPAARRHLHLQQVAWTPDAARRSDG
ncbi:hypothetical protein EYF80_035685 [Liparis tanakae]|uniref:Uncharacterized protein n=1 Tax=Liparis tanakae TaxID=230148 RepID=A0A4Z2GKX3_9TELE|nr:hypothetical protein EYF80_035685 [Liparis tanakae]